MKIGIVGTGNMGRSPGNPLVKLKHKTYTRNSNIFLLRPLTLTLREVFTIDSFTD
jgi:3-hydroxyisobutyrate dehydrogenase-like beta-hydroxyacid dehydrogenase